MIKELKLTPYLRRKVRSLALYSFYKMNAPYAVGYSFSLYEAKNGKVEWDGGWINRLTNLDQYENRDYIFDFKKDRIYKNKEA